MLVGTGFVQLFFPYNHLFELGYSVVGCAVFSGYILYDTYLIQQRYVACLTQPLARRLDSGQHLALSRCGQPVPVGPAQYVPLYAHAVVNAASDD